MDCVSQSFYSVQVYTAGIGHQACGIGKDGTRTSDLGTRY